MKEPGGVDGQPRTKRMKQTSLLVPSVQVGTATATFGFIAGGTAGVLRGTTPVLFAIVSGAQWFGLGSVFWLGRGSILRYTYKDVASPREKVYASMFAGGLAGGTIGAAMRGRSNVIPGLIMGSLFGLGGQSFYNVVDASKTERESAKSPKKENLIRRITEARWSPMQNLSDEQYENMLKEKLIHLDAEIAVIDDKITEMREAQNESKERSS